jgi:hypothetical protein
VPEIHLVSTIVPAQNRRGRSLHAMEGQIASPNDNRQASAVCAFLTVGLLGPIAGVMAVVGGTRAGRRGSGTEVPASS